MTWTKKEWTAEMLTLIGMIDRTEEVGECMEWQGGYSHGKPSAYSKNVRVMVRRHIAEAQGKDIEGKRVVPACGNYRCICHNKAVTIPQSMAFAGRDVNVFARNRSISAARRKNGKVTEEMAMEIRASTDNNIVEAAKHGIHHSYVSLIRRDKAFRSATMQSNPFASLISANDAARRRA